MATYTFDGINSLIILPLNVTTINVNDIYSRWVDWVLTSDNSKYLPAFRSVGGDPISGTLSLSPTYFLTNGWYIRPSEADQYLTVNGNLFTDPSGSNPFIATLGNYNVVIQYVTSNVVSTIATGSGLTTNEHNQLFAVPTRQQLLPIIA